MVMDVEFVHILNPSQRQLRQFNLPSIFCNHIWNGIRKGFTTKVFEYILPCHACRKSCALFRKNILNYNCFNRGFDFLEEEMSLIESLLLAYDNFQIYSYGKSDAFQLEHATTYCTDSFELKHYKRKNRKIERRIVDISTDLYDGVSSINQIEDGILEKWLIGWKRNSEAINVNQKFMVKYGTPNWKENYNLAINKCIEDSTSALLYHLYQNYRKSYDSIKIPVVKTIFDF